MEGIFKNIVEAYMADGTVIEDQEDRLIAEVKTAKENLTLSFQYRKEYRLFQITLLQRETGQYWHESWVDFAKPEEEVRNQIQATMRHLSYMVHYTNLGA